MPLAKPGVERGLPLELRVQRNELLSRAVKERMYLVLMPQGKTFARQEVVIGAPAPQSLAKEQKLGLDLRVRAPRYVEGLQHLKLGVLRLSRGNRIEVGGSSSSHSAPR